MQRAQNQAVAAKTSCPFHCGLFNRWARLGWFTLLIACLPEMCLAGKVVGGFDLARGGYGSIGQHPANNGFRFLITAINRGATFASTNELTPEFLDSIDLFVLTSLRSTSGDPAFIPLSAAEQAALYQYVLDGGEIFYSTGDLEDPGPGSAAANESMLGQFGLHYSDAPFVAGTASFNDNQHPIAQSDWGGPITEFSLDADGHFDALGPYANSLAYSVNTGLPVLVEIPRDALGPGSGRVIAFSSTPALTDNAGTLTVNIAAYVLLPEPSTWALAASGTLTALGGTWWRRRRKAQKPTDGR